MGSNATVSLGILSETWGRATGGETCTEVCVLSTIDCSKSRSFKHSYLFVVVLYFESSLAGQPPPWLSDSLIN